MNVQRRRVDTNDAARVFLPSAEATQEIRPEDVLEAVDVEGGVRRARASSSDREHSSIAPLALDIYAHDYASPPAVDTSELRIPMRPPPNPKMLALVGGALGVCILILVGAGIRTAVATTEGGVAVAPTTTAPPSPKAAAAIANGAVGVDSLPPAPVSGTIVFPKKANVSLDGAHVTATSAIVRCGDHTVRFGRGATRHIDVPCGGTLDLDRKSR
jgi:hypothetical protein